eukprot:TRINITY_DN5233_c0_g1_i2.p1 TRINITY_DN5233_c0_g1~~TRINITY_DN5233_c0_g1_i2.p1  ORF type:complete len:124 (+),score=7.17 TRINITY_DN5233_c0_g1_i2:247-618(+)
MAHVDVQNDQQLAQIQEEGNQDPILPSDGQSLNQTTGTNAQPGNTNSISNSMNLNESPPHSGILQRVAESDSQQSQQQQSVSRLEIRDTGVPSRESISRSTNCLGCFRITCNDDETEFLMNRS